MSAISKVSIQQLLRPTETCKFIVRGQHLDVPYHGDRVITIIKHEGTAEHAMFVFEVDSMGSLIINKVLPIRGSFNAFLQSSGPGGCNVSVNTADGEVIVYRLPYDTTTAMLFSQIKVALDSYSASASVNSPSSFDWLRGYEGCRTGWDRFCKPRSHTSPNVGEGFPDNWPWSYIITPNSNGSTEVAMCESLLHEFDPLHTTEDSSRPSSTELYNVHLSHPSKPAASPSPPHSLNPSVSGKSTNPFLKIDPIRSSRSETNISTLGLEQKHRAVSPMKTIQATKSQNALADKKTAILVTRSPDDSRGASPRVSPRTSPYQLLPRPQGCVFESSGSMDNPFQEEYDSEEMSEGTRFWLNQDELDIEMKQVEPGEGGDKGRTGMGKRTASLDVLNERDTSTASSVTKEVVLDYSFRRMRSIHSSPSNTFMTQSVEVVSDLPPRLQQTRSKTSSVQSSKAASRSPKLFRKKITPKGGALDTSKSSWITRYQPGVLLLKGSMRECLIQRMLHEREDEFCEYANLSLFCGTWNVNGQLPIQRVDKWLLSDKDVPDIYAIGFQELDLSPEALLTKESNREDMWMDLVESSLKQSGKKFKRICYQRLVGILLIVYVQQSLVPFISEVESDLVPCGIMGHLGNKGGVAIRFNIHHSSICIVNSHLAAHMDEVEKRNQDYHQIYSRLQFFKNSQLPYSITEHNMVIWMGDLNYRLQTPPNMTPDLIKAYADSYQLHKLLPFDQLHLQQKKGEAFTQFHEGKIDFKPTYKYDPSTNSWDTSEKNRAPAWCDRVLFYSKEDLLDIVNYQSYPEMIISDHKPVSCLFTAKVKHVVPEKEKDVLEQITWKLDKQENDTLPQVKLNSLEFKFELVKFMVKQTKHLNVHNVGQRPIQLSFIPTPDKENAISKSWLTVKPDRALILTGEEVTIELSLLVDTELAPLLQNKRETLEDILVLHLEGGKDFFISVTGNYLSSSFGSSLETLVHIHTNIREVPTADLIDIQASGSWEKLDENGCEIRDTPPPLDIPKELFRLVQYLMDRGLKTENLFTDGGLTAEQERIRDILDTGDSKMYGGVFSVAATLLLFLRSLSEPVVPREFHQRCMEGCNNATLCKQLLMNMPTVHRRTFVFMITFLKKILQHSAENQMDAKVIASIFGDILLNADREIRSGHNKRSLAHMNKKKATFIYQFLVNDLTVEYK